jgi:hypothetical protein
MKDNMEKKIDGAATPGKKRGAFHLITRPIKAVCDPITQTCYPILESHWQERYRKPWPLKYARRMFILDFFLLTTIATLVVTLMVFGLLLPVLPTTSVVNIETVAPQEFVSGETTTFAVAYSNDSDRMLGCAQLRLRLPEGTVVDDYAETADETRKYCLAAGERPHAERVPGEDGIYIFPIGDLAPHAKDTLSLTARTYGASGSLKILSSELTYWELARTVPTRVSSRTEWQVARSALQLVVAAPKDLVRGRQTSVTVAYANRGNAPLRNVRLAVDAPADFTVSGASPALGKGREWRLGDLAAGDGGTVTLYGAFSARPGIRPAPTVSFRGLADDGGVVLVEEVRHNADPLAGDIEFSHDITQPGGRTALLPGETVVVAVRYRNRGTTSLNGLHVELSADRRLLASAAPENLSWDIPSVAPGASGELQATLAVKDAIDAATLGPDGEPHLFIAATGSYVVGDDTTRPVRVDSATTDFPIATRLTVDAAGFYFTKDGDQVGLGPLPPKAGETTKYRVFLHLRNTTSGADNVRVEGYLPANVAWTGKYSVTSGQAIDFFPTTGRIRWDVGRVPAFTDGTGSGIGASFEVALTAGADDVGTTPILIKDVALTADDELTGLTLHASAGAVTTDLQFDARAAGKGVVVK